MTVAARPRARGSRASREAPPSGPRVLAAAIDWAEAHCVVPDGPRRGAPLRLYEWQALFLGRFYLVRPDAGHGTMAPAFAYRRAMMVGPQKLGKDPMEAVHVCIEGVGPATFAGWAGADDGWACADNGCRCGWERPYDPGEPMGARWPTPLVQVTAPSEDATQNTYDALRPMIELGPLADVVSRVGEEFIRLPNGGRIDTVTSSAQSRLGQRVTFVTQGEAGLYTKANGMAKVADTQYRGLAGMGGRAALHTNAWDPSEASVAQRHAEQAAPDVWVQFERPPSGLSMRVRDERVRILRAVYPPEVRRENGGHLDLDAIEAEAADMAAYDLAQAERFFGNRIVTGSGRAFDLALWGALARPAGRVPDGASIALGFDGSKTGDHTALVAAGLESGLVWPLGAWDPLDHGGEVPRDLVDAAVADAFARWKVVRMHADPPYWKEEVAAWQGRHGDKVVLPWETWRNRPMGHAVRAFAQAIADGTLTHDGDERLARHVGACQRKPLNERDDKGAPLWTVQKDTPDSPRKIDAAVAAVLAWEARSDAIAGGALNRRRWGAFTA